MNVYQVSYFPNLYIFSCQIHYFNSYQEHLSTNQSTISIIFSLKKLKNTSEHSCLLIDSSPSDVVPNSSFRWFKVNLSRSPIINQRSTSLKVYCKLALTYFGHYLNIWSFFPIQQCPMMNFGQFLLTDALVIFPGLIFLILILFGMGVLLLMLSGSISNKFLKIIASISKSWR